AGDDQFLRVLLNKGARALGHGGDASLIRMAREWLWSHPELHCENIEWDATGKAALTNGVLDFRTREFTTWAPEHCLRRKLNVAYDSEARAPETEQWLQEIFADRGPDAPALINLQQEFLGGSLCVPLLTREQRRALLLYGPSGTAKTELAR